MTDSPDWAVLLDPGTGWLVPGCHPLEMEDIYAEFVAHTSEWDRRTTWMALEHLLKHSKELFPSGRLLIGGTFISRQVGPCEAPEVAVVPDEPSSMELWTDTEEARFQLCMSLHDVIVGSLGPDYFEVLHPFAGRIESFFVVPDDVDQVTTWMGTSTLLSGEDLPGHRGVVEVEW
ncbi:DUF6932 family protein [Agromyces lapidis]|uniref:DUF6932 family protein n=1 Tax=Agromyces lapidis TaxID=279574 RepID=A0ABV5SV02_9MICO|nr:hypothetical protein [Agromyces lapidis]